MSRAENARERLFGNLRALMEDVEELVKATAEQTDNRVSSLRERILPTLESVRGTLSSGREMLSSSKQGAKAAIYYAEENPWATAGIATGAVMALVCFLWSRCTR
jgi:ElaB/YqjD/DUF883 family membrane-anchored ribosome-binding protein